MLSHKDHQMMLWMKSPAKHSGVCPPPAGVVLRSSIVSVWITYTPATFVCRLTTHSANFWTTSRATMNSSFRGGMQVHAVPEDERARDSRGQALPWGYAYAEYVHCLRSPPFSTFRGEAIATTAQSSHADVDHAPSGPPSTAASQLRSADRLANRTGDPRHAARRPRRREVRKTSRDRRT